MKGNRITGWILRFIKGIFIGSGFILPGVSGGALAAVFGIYEKLISFLAHITKDFMKNVMFFIPVGLGGLAGVFVFAIPVNYFLKHYEIQTMWFFVGCIAGTLPLLWKQAGKKGRKTTHLFIGAITCVLGTIFLLYGEKLFSGGVPQNFLTWILAGALIGLGTVVPGLSPSNFLLYMGLYEPLTEGIKNRDMMVIIPLALGAIACVLLLSKLMDMILSKAYIGVFHFILGIVLASTIVIIPFNTPLDIKVILISVALFAAGAALGTFMGKLEEKYKTAD